MTKLNVGCGEFRAKGWLNVDVVASKTHRIKPDLVVDVFDLPPDITSLDSVYCGHFLEHLRPNRIVPCLVHLRSRMRPGAEIAVVGPDVNRATNMYREGKLDEQTWRACHATLGDSEWEGCNHYWDCSEGEVIDYLKEAGFMGVRPVDIGSPELNPYPVVARVRWQCAVLAMAI